MFEFELKLCFDNYANSKFRFIVKNCSKNTFFYIRYVAEILFYSLSGSKLFLEQHKLKDSVDNILLKLIRENPLNLS